MSCSQCLHFTPLEKLTDSGYCDWLKSSQALVTRIPTSVEALREIGILMTKEGGEDCRAFARRRIPLASDV